MLYAVILTASLAGGFMMLAATRLSAAQVAALTEAAYYSALHPCWPQLYANGQSYAMLPEDAQRLGLRDGDELPLTELAVLLLELKETEQC